MTDYLSSLDVLPSDTDDIRYAKKEASHDRRRIHQNLHAIEGRGKPHSGADRRGVGCESGFSVPLGQRRTDNRQVHSGSNSSLRGSESPEVNNRQQTPENISKLHL